MRLRVVFANFFIRLGRFIQSLAIMVMRPDDLVEFSKQQYSRPKSIENWSWEELLDSGLEKSEKDLLKKIPLKKGRLLLLEVGGGREAIPLGKMGFKITGVDFVPDMLERAKKNAEQHGVKIEGVVQEISKLEMPVESYDIAWLSAGMYSSVPTRERRIDMLKRIGRSLKPGGYFVCQAFMKKDFPYSDEMELVRKVFAHLTIGNLWYEKGDRLWHNGEFIHFFPSENNLISEFEQAGFKVVHIQFPNETMIGKGGAVLRKPPVVQ